MLKWKIINI